MKDKKKELLEKILIKVYEINENTRYDVFFSFSGRSKAVFVHYCVEGVLQTLGYAYLDFVDSVDKLEKILEKLTELEEK